ncbi:hypothetical protein EXIGLDRAFT_835579 [Exidia glandulosa HHB12029]|uniref:Non-specific serine/threonine protein kinase n=1 Tax=Exidia glandulosa HHB12029 TaxID=1314781 RepID=A0A165INY5_EXIGL|nr:hypothetical protein EXIGLDRAFT_835579 [Exidia glandulosa HHB12029]
MLAGYLPFDDDPANPDGDNINLLYKYIINTPLTFPDYISDDARDLLSKMLVPDPTRRADLDTIMNHHWLRTYRHFFDRTVEECEEAAVLQYEQKRQEYSRKLRARQPDEESSHRSRRAERATLADTSAPPSSFAGSAGVMSESALSAYANHSMDVDSAAAASTNSRRAQAVSAIVLPTQRRNERPDASMMSLDQDSVIVDVYPTKQPTHVPPPVAAEEPVSSKEKASNKRRQKAADRHTIQVEYDDPEAGRATSRPAMPMAAQDVFSPAERENGNGRAAPPVVDQQERVARSRMGSTPPVALSHAFASQHVDETPVLPPKTVSVTVTSPPPADPSPKRSNSVRTTGSKSRSRVSLGALGKVFNSPSPASPSVEEPQQVPKEQAPARAVSLSVSQHSQQSSSHGSRGQTATEDDQTSAQETTVTDAGDSSFAKMKRRTLNLVVGSSRTERKSSRQSKQVEKPAAADVPAATPITNGANKFTPAPVALPELTGNAASTSKAKRVMDWFRTRSQNRGRPEDMGVGGGAPAPLDMRAAHKVQQQGAPATAHPMPQLVVTTPYDQAGGDPLMTPVTPSVPALSRVANTLVNSILPPRSVSSSAVSSLHAHAEKATTYPLRVHHGAVDQGTVTTGSPPEVFAHVTHVLASMGVEFHKETEFKYRCVRPKRRKIAGSTNPPPSPHKEVTGQGVAAYTMVGSASLNGVDKRGLPHPSPTISSPAGMLRGLLTRRASSHVSDPDEEGMRSPVGASTSTRSVAPQPLPAEGGAAPEPLYGDRAQDLSDEVRFSVELTRIDRLDDTLSLDIRRLKGNLKSYKFLYDTLRDRCQFTQ